MRWFDAWRAPAPDARRVGWLRDWDYAHRGLHGGGLHGGNSQGGVPENSPSAFADAIARGIGIELDVQRSRDGRAMVFHDWDLDRLTDETGPLLKRNADAIERIRLTGNDDHIPTLRRTLDQIGGKVPVLIELKSAFDKRSIPLCLAVQRALEGYRGKHAVMSFDPAIIRWFAIHAPRIVRGLVVEETGKKGVRGKAERRLALSHARPDFLAYHIGDLPSPFAAAQRKRGLPVLTWTVRTQAQNRTGTAHADALIAEFEAPE